MYLLKNLILYFTLIYPITHHKKSRPTINIHLTHLYKLIFINKLIIVIYQQVVYNIPRYFDFLSLYTVEVKKH